MPEGSQDQGGDVQACKDLWKKAKGFPMADAMRDNLLLEVGEATLTPADVSIWEEPEVDAKSVGLEVLFVGAPFSLDSELLKPALSTKIEAFLQEQKREEFRSQLAKKQDATLRRRKKGADEDGDTAEDKWREYIKKPAQDTRLKVHSVYDTGTRLRRVLGCRISMSPQAARLVGESSFAHIFKDEDELNQKWYEDPVLSCFYCSFFIVIVIFVLWICLLLSATSSNR